MLITISFIVIIRSIIFYENPDWFVAIVFTNFSASYFLVGPFFFFHIRTYLTGHFGVSRKDFIHFVPSILQFANVLPYILTSFEHKLEIAQNLQKNLLFIHLVDVNIFFSYQVTALFPPIFILGYGLYSIYKLVYNYSLGLDQRVKKMKYNAISHGWLIYLCIVIILISAGNLILTYNLSYISDQVQIKPFAFIQSILLVSIPISLILTPQVLYGIAFNKNFGSIFRSNNKPLTKSTPELDKNVSLSDLIHEVMEKDKPFLEHSFSLDDLVTLLNVPKHHVYNCLNEVMNIKFTDLRSHYRVEHAKKMLLEMDKKNITIEAIGIESGFPTRSSFYRAFKAETGITPTEYVEGKPMEGEL